MSVEINKYTNCHKTWHKFYKWLQKNFGNDLYTESVYSVKQPNGRIKKIKLKNYNEYELSSRLVGYEVIEKIEKYVKRNAPEIKIIHCDDAIYAGSIILLIPHPEHGITMMFIPQLTDIQNQIFLYGGHYKMLLEELNKMKYVYNEQEL